MTGPSTSIPRSVIVLTADVPPHAGASGVECKDAAGDRVVHHGPVTEQDRDDAPAEGLARREDGHVERLDGIEPEQVLDLIDGLAPGCPR